MTKKIKINEKLEELKKIIDGFEKNEFDLDSGMERYKQAIEIIKGLEKELSARELELKEVRSEII